MGAQKAADGAQRRRPYTEDDDGFIAQHYGNWSNRQIAEALGRTESGVRYRARKLGLERVSYEAPKVEEVCGEPGERLSRLLALRDMMEGDILGGVVPMMQRPAYYREYRALLAEISELEGDSDAKPEAKPKSSLADALAGLAEQQRKLLERAAGA